MADILQAAVFILSCLPDVFCKFTQHYLFTRGVEAKRDAELASFVAVLFSGTLLGTGCNLHASSAGVLQGVVSLHAYQSSSVALVRSSGSGHCRSMLARCVPPSALRSQPRQQTKYDVCSAASSMVARSSALELAVHRMGCVQSKRCSR